MNIKQIRINCGITQLSLAEGLSVDRSTIAKWETGEAKPTADKIPKIAEILGCTIDELFNDERK